MSPYRTPGQGPSLRRPGGTSGGTGTFLIGLAMLVAGGYLFLDNVQVTSHLSELWGFGHGTFGLSLIPLFVGVIITFYDGTNKIGWFLTGAGLLIIFVGVISRLTIYFQRRSLFDTLLIFVLMAGGVGLIARSLKEHNAEQA